MICTIDHYDALFTIIILLFTKYSQYPTRPLAQPAVSLLDLGWTWAVFLQRRPASGALSWNKTSENGA